MLDQQAFEKNEGKDSNLCNPQSCNHTGILSRPCILYITRNIIACSELYRGTGEYLPVDILVKYEMT